MSWIAIAITYLAVGATFVLVGPAASELRYERRRYRAGMMLFPVPAWKEWGLLIAIGAGIILFWPILVPSAYRSRQGSNNAKAPRMPKLTRAGRARVDEARRTGPRVLSLDEYEKIGDGLQFDDWFLLSNEMEQLGFTVDAARTDTGKRFPVSLRVMKEVGSPLILSRPGQKGIDEGSDDGRWHFTNSDDHWAHLAGRAGEAVVRGNVVVKIHVTMMN